MIRSKHNINTGKIIERFMNKHKINSVDFGTAIGRKGITVRSYFTNSSIQTDILLDICHAYRHNFFRDMADQLPADFARSNPEGDKEMMENKSRIALLEEENKVLKIQNELMKKALGIKE